MATDYVTSPNTPKGEVIFGIGAGLLVVFIRYFGGYPEGVCYHPHHEHLRLAHIDKITLPKRFGVTAEMRKAEKEQAKAAKKAAKEGRGSMNAKERILRCHDHRPGCHLLW